MVVSGSKRRAGVIALWVAGVLAALGILTLAGYSANQYAILRAQAARLATLEQRVTDMSTDQRLLAAIVAAETPTATAKPAAQPATATAIAPTAPGTRRVFGVVRGVSSKPYGWELRVDSAEYLTGTAAFSLASSMGKLTESDGSFILDSSDRTTRLKLLKDAKVTVVAWPGASKDSTASISAGELTDVLPGGKSADPKWAKAWLWLDVRDGYVLQVTQQRVE